MTKNRLKFPGKVPLSYDDHGTIRVAGSRVTLHTLVGRYQIGDTLEEIHEGFPSIPLAQIDAIISWYLENQTEVDAHIREVDIEAAKVRQEIESRPENIAFREKIRTLRKQQLTKT